MDYVNFSLSTLSALGFDPHIEPNAFMPPLDIEWPLKLPDIEFTDRTLLVLNFQDRMNWNGHGYYELDRVQEKYGKNSDRVLVTTLHYNVERYHVGPVHTVEFNTHNIRESTRLKQHDTSWVNNPKTVNWQCLSGRTLRFRQQVANILKTWDNGWLSYGTEIALPEWDYGTYRGTENDENFMRLRKVYETAAVNIVTETGYEYPCVISEKSLFAFAARQVPIIIGHQGIIQDCENLGFDMFRDVVDTSYDDLPNETRLEQALIRNQDLILGKIDLSSLSSRLDANRRYAIDGGLVEHYCQRFQKKAQELAQRLIPV